MVQAYLLRDGTGERHVASRIEVPASVLRGRTLSKGWSTIPQYSLDGTFAEANAVSEPTRVALRANDPEDARLLGATPGAYHFVLDFSPADLRRARVRAASV